MTEETQITAESVAPIRITIDPSTIENSPSTAPSEIQEEPQAIVEEEQPIHIRRKEFGNSIFDGKKHRRASSVSKEFIGDHLDVAGTPEIMQLFNESELLLFSDHANRLTDKSHMADCTILVSSTQLFLLNARMNQYLTPGPIPISMIQCISTSQEKDNAIVIHLPDYQTEVLMTSFKIELTSILAEQYMILKNKELEIKFSNVIEFPISSEALFEFDFVRAVDGVRMSLFIKANETGQK